MKKMMYWILAVPFLIGVFLAVLSVLSTREPDLGIMEGKLAPCAKASNCVCSERPESQAYVRPISLNGPPESEWKNAKEVIASMGGRIRKEEKGYLWATFSSRFFRFYDDLEMRLSSAQGCIHVRSSSRVGYSDFGVNRKRVERIRSLYQQEAINTEE